MSALLEYKCPRCGGAIEFDSSLQKMKCPYCDTEFDVQTLIDYDEDLKNDREDELNWESEAGNEWDGGETDGMQVYVCQSCGGEIITDETTGATNCPFCGNPVVVKEKFSGDLKPDYIIPFKLDKTAAKEALKKHLEGKILLPNVFKSENKIDEIKGVYVPFWLFDTEADARIRYDATSIRVWRDRNFEYTETSHFNVVRSGTLSFDCVPVDGSSKMDDTLMESIEPFDFSEAVPFQTAFLSGYLADRYDVSSEDSTERANARVKKSTEEAFAETITAGYASVTPVNSSVQLKSSKASYALYPVWVLNSTWRGKNYTFAMNGQTGKFVGDLPMDKGKFYRWFAGITAVSGVAVYFIGTLMGLM